MVAQMTIREWNTDVINSGFIFLVFKATEKINSVDLQHGVINSYLGYLCRPSAWRQLDYDILNLRNGLRLEEVCKGKKKGGKLCVFLASLNTASVF